MAANSVVIKFLISQYTKQRTDHQFSPVSSTAKSSMISINVKLTIFKKSVT